MKGFMQKNKTTAEQTHRQNRRCPEFMVGDFVKVTGIVRSVFMDIDGIHYRIDIPSVSSGLSLMVDESELTYSECNKYS